MNMKLSKEEKEILKYAKKKKLPFIEGKCPYAEYSYRIKVREFLWGLTKKDRENIKLHC